MATLANLQGGSLVSNLTGLGQGIERGAQAFAAGRERDAQLQRQQDQQQLIGNLSDKAIAGGQDALTRLASQAPQVANAVVKIIQSRDTQSANKFQQLANRAGNIAATAKKSNNPNIARQIYIQEADKLQKEGDEASAREALNMAELALSNPDRFDAELNLDIFGSEDSNTLFKMMGMGAKPETKVVNKQLLERQPDGTWRVVGPQATGAGIEAPAALLSGLTEEAASKGAAAFQAAGGGKDGVKALNEAVKIAQTTQQLEDVPQILDSAFPNASTAERAQIDAAVQGSKTVESGLKRAEKIRTEQRRLKKAKGFQERAITLLTGILASDQIGDVTGSIEGGTTFRFSDVESELIADIEEVQNILTAENMDLMSGVLSESDIALLRNLASGALNRRRGEKRFKADAKTLLDKLSSQIVQTVDDRQNQASSNSDTQALAWARNNPNDPRAAQIISKLEAR